MEGPLYQRLEAWLATGEGRVGEIIVQRRAEHWTLRHQADASADALTRYDQPEAAREIGKVDCDRKFRPLKTAPTLVRGWELRLADLHAVQLALEFFYPAALGNWHAADTGALAVPTLRETLNRQTGMYRVTGLLQDDEAHELVGRICGPHQCLRRVLWKLPESDAWRTLPPEKQTWPAPADGFPLLCSDACPLFVGEARTVVKARLNAAPPPAE
jgi:sirohydrochlorin cobaltochelatase